MQDACQNDYLSETNADIYLNFYGHLGYGVRTSRRISPTTMSLTSSTHPSAHSQPVRRGPY